MSWFKCWSCGGNSRVPIGSHSKREECKNCNGSEDCKVCNGVGTVIVTIIDYDDCSVCHGTGVTWKNDDTTGSIS